MSDTYDPPPRASDEPTPEHGRPCAHGLPAGRPWTGACHRGDDQPVYFIGALGLDLASESRSDAFAEAMPTGDSPFSTADLLAHIERRPWDAASVIWTLTYEDIPIYAVAPLGFEQTGYEQLGALLRGQLEDQVERVSVAGLLNGTVDLSIGFTVPVIVPDTRGIVGWERHHLSTEAWCTEKADFLQRVFHDLRNLGQSPDERALNYATTQAHIVFAVLQKAYEEELVLENVSVAPSPITRPGSDCRDVTLRFFNPGARFEQARREFRVTVDVADTLPTTVGEVRSWPVY